MQIHNLRKGASKISIYYPKQSILINNKSNKKKTTIITKMIIVICQCTCYIESKPKIPALALLQICKSEQASPKRGYHQPQPPLCCISHQLPNLPVLQLHVPIIKQRLIIYLQQDYKYV